MIQLHYYLRLIAMNILFYDALAPRSYTYHSMATSALRGTESTLLHIAQGLAKQHKVTICQPCRTEDVCENQINYFTTATALTLSPDIVVLVRSPQQAEFIAESFPQARHYLWLHNIPSKRLWRLRQVLAKYKFTVIGVSAFHQRAIERRLQGKWYQRLIARVPQIPVTYIYNPLPDALQADATLVNPQQMIFTSAISKGLDQVLQAFTLLRQTYPEYELLITNPDNAVINYQLPPNTRLLGALAKPDLLAHIRSSFCVFYPQTQSKETFGLVYAEANAVGTPVLAHNFGAAREILHPCTQAIDTTNFSHILNTIAQWRIERPQVQAKPEFRLSAVLSAWQRLLID